MRFRIALVIASLLFTVGLHTKNFACRRNVIANQRAVLPNATVVVNGDKIERVAMGKRMLPRSADRSAAHHMPGCVNEHVASFNAAICSPDLMAPISTAYGRQR